MPKATGMIGRNEIRDGEIVAEHLAASAVTAAKLANSTITLAKLGGNIIKEDTITLTNAEFLNLRATPKTLVAAGGAGTAHIVVGALLSSLASGGAYTETADNLAVKYTNGSGQTASGAIETTGVIDSTSQTYSYAPATTCAPAANAALVLHNIGDGEFGGGNAANVMTLRIRYYTLTL